MTRRGVLFSLFLLPAGCSMRSRASKPSRTGGISVYDGTNSTGETSGETQRTIDTLPENVFAFAYNDWIVERNKFEAENAKKGIDTRKILNLNDLRGWNRVKSAWNDLRRATELRLNG